MRSHSLQQAAHVLLSQSLWPHRCLHGCCQLWRGTTDEGAGREGRRRTEQWTVPGGARHEADCSMAAPCVHAVRCGLPNRPAHPARPPAVSSAPPSAPANRACLDSCSASTLASMLSRTSRRDTVTGLRGRRGRRRVGRQALRTACPVPPYNAALPCSLAMQCMHAAPPDAQHPSWPTTLPPGHQRDGSWWLTSAAPSGARARLPAALSPAPAPAPAKTRGWRAPARVCGVGLYVGSHTSIAFSCRTLGRPGHGRASGPD